MVHETSSQSPLSLENEQFELQKLARELRLDVTAIPALRVRFHALFEKPTIGDMTAFQKSMISRPVLREDIGENDERTVE
jgi:NRPS condensation-like uncharacterized protein